jgi:hypothetical protein
MMSLEPKTIAEQIECLARLTGAPQSFVCQVKDLFSKKGIPLSADAAPYIKALEEAFKREETIRTNAQRARRNIERLADNFTKIGKSYVRQLEQLQKIKANLRSQAAAKAQRPRERLSELPSRTGIEPGSRHFMTPQVSDELPLVPGPEEEQ